MIRVVVVGGGNLAEAVSLALCEAKGVELTQIYLRDPRRGESLAALTAAPTALFGEPLAVADIYLLAVSDSAVGELSRTLDFAAGAVVAHTAGSIPLEAIDSSLRRAVFYPMQTFTRGRKVDFSAIPIFVEAHDSATLAQVKELAERLTSVVQELDSESRARLHLAAVFVCNFVNAMFVAGEEIVAQSNLSFDILKPLIAECCSKGCDAASPRDVQTGPAVRGDEVTVERHTVMLEDENLKMIYQNLSKYIWETSKKI